MTIPDRPHRMLTVCGGTRASDERIRDRDTFVIADLESGEISRPCIRTDVWISRPGLLMLVCDGVDGVAAGDVAARLAATSIKHELEAEGDNVGHSPQHSLKRAVVGANKAILEEAKVHPEERGMSTTCTAAIASPDRLSIAQVGDSRAYLFRDGRLRRLTRDQTAAPNVGAAEAATSRASSSFDAALTHALGASASVRPVVTDVELCEGDRVLLCSAGLHGPVSEEKISEIIGGLPEVAEVSEALIAAALATGRPENVTVVVADCGPLSKKARRDEERTTLELESTVATIRA